MTGYLNIVQWREPYDDDDTQTCFAFAKDDQTDYLDLIREEHSIPTPTDETPDDGEGQIYVINELTIPDGEIWETNGRKFRINITEVTE